MPKTKSHGHSTRTVVGHKSPISMDKVKIKRVKRNHKKVTTKEKILGGIGIGSTLIGGVSQVTPQHQKTQIVSSQKAVGGSSTSKLRDTLRKIFSGTVGVQTAKA